MADPILNILQGETVYYDPDTTTGSVASYTWTFPGGTPGTSNLHYPVVTYSNIGTYNTTLSVTDTYGTTRDLTKYQIINVEKNALAVSFDVPAYPVRMNELFTITDTSVPVPNDWEWVIPEIGTVTGVQDLINYQFNDWYNATGTYLGEPGATADVQVQLTAATNFDVGTATNDMVVKKLGGGQDFVDLTYDWVTTYGPTAFVLTTSLGTTGGAPIFLSNYGLTGNPMGFVAVVDDSGLRTVGPISSPGTGRQVNNYFHSNQEIAQYTGHFGFTTVSDYANGLTGYIIVDPSIYNYAQFGLNNGIDFGNYILENYIYDNRGSMFADRGGFLTTKWLPPSTSTLTRGWPISLLNEFLHFASPVRSLSRDVEEPYKLAGGTGGGTPALLYSNALSALHGNNTISLLGVVGVPSTGFILPRTNPIGDQYFKISISVQWSNGIDVILTNFDASVGLNGNDGFGFFKAQNVGPNNGIATILNNSINSYFSAIPLASPIVVKESEDYNPYFVPSSFVYGATAYNNRSDYHGLLVESLDPSVSNIQVTDNSANIIWTVPVLPSTGVGLSGPAAFPQNWLAPTNARFRYASWLGAINTQNSLPAMSGITPGLSGGWYYGGSL
jgi:hypothetical protein